MVTLHLHTEFDDGEVVVTVIGELDVATVADFQRFIGHVPIAVAVFDCRLVSFIDAHGLSALIHSVRERGARVITSGAVARLVEICEIDLAMDVDRWEQRRPRLEHATFGVAVHDTALRYRFVNRALARINGLEVASHLGKRPVELFRIERDDLSALLDEVLTSGRRRSVTVAGSTATGDLGAWQCSYFPVYDAMPLSWRDDGSWAPTGVVAVVETGSEPGSADLALRFDAAE